MFRLITRSRPRVRTMDEVFAHLEACKTEAEMRPYRDARAAWDGLYKGQKGLSLVKLFLKFEATKPSDPRIISPREAILQLWLMMYVQPLEAAVKAVPDEESWSVKGKSLQEVEDALRPLFGRGGVAYEIDQKRFDAHVNEFLRHVELEVFCAIFPNDADHLRWLFPKLWKMFGVSTFGLVVVLAFLRSSGEVTTSIGNLIINCFFFWYLVKYYLPEAKLLPKNEGDDAFGVVFGVTEEEFRKAVHLAARDLGLEADVIIKRNLDEAAFLARYFSDQHVSVCDIKRALSKFHVSGKTVHTVREVKALAKAKALSYCVSDWSTPCLWAVLSAILKDTSDVDADTNVKDCKRWSRGAVKQPTPPTMEVRYWVERCQGITVAEQMLFESQFEHGIPSRIDYPLDTGIDIMPAGFQLATYPSLLNAMDYVTITKLNA